jgi:hypothetical protein
LLKSNGLVAVVVGNSVSDIRGIQGDGVYPVTQPDALETALGTSWNVTASISGYQPADPGVLPRV